MKAWTQRRRVRWPAVLITILIVLLSASCIWQGVKVNRLDREIHTQRVQIETLQHEAITQDQMIDIMGVIGKDMRGLRDRVYDLEGDNVRRHGA